MALLPKFADRVKETTTTTGTGTLTLGGAVSGNQTFDVAFDNGDRTYYCIESGADFETGIGTYSSGTLSRDRVLTSTGSFTAGSAGNDWTYDVLAMHMNGADNGTTFTDEKGKVITRIGTPVTKTGVFKYGTASAYFNGTTDCLSVPNSTAFDFGALDFTIEMFVYVTSLAANGALVAKRWSADTYTPFIVYVSTSGYLNTYTSTTGTSWLTGVGTTAIPTSAWRHVAIVRSGTTIKTYLEGALESTIDVGTAPLMVNTRPVYIGGETSNGSTVVTPFAGYIDDLRIARGYARYTAAFTPPTAEFSYSAGAPSYSDVVFHASFNGTNGATTFTDHSKFNHQIVNYYASLDTAVTPIAGGSSCAFDGVKTQVCAHSNEFAFGTGDFTIELWVRLNALGADKGFIDMRQLSRADGAYPYIGLHTDTTSLAYYANSAYKIIGGTLTTGTWYHVAYCRAGSIGILYLDGTSVGSWTDTTDYSEVNTVSIGANCFGGYQYLFNGNIADVRITKYARYSGNFTRPAAFYSTDTNKLNLAAGTKNVFCTFPAREAGATQPDIVTMTVGASGYDFTSLNQLATYHKCNNFPDQSTVVIEMQDGDYVTTGITFAYKPGVTLWVRGAPKRSLAITSVVSISGSTAAWSIVLGVSSTTQVAVGDYIVVKSATGGVSPLRLTGAHKVTNIGSGQITIMCRHRWTVNTFMSGAVTATASIHKTIINASTAATATTTLYLSGVFSLDRVCVVSSDTGGVGILQTTQWCVASLFGDLAVVAQQGVYASQRGQIFVIGSVASACAIGGNGFLGYQGGQITFNGVAYATGGSTAGYHSGYGANLLNQSQAIVSVGNTYGFYSTNGSYIQAQSYGTTDNVTAVSSPTANTVGNEDSYVDT